MFFARGNLRVTWSMDLELFAINRPYYLEKQQDWEHTIANEFNISLAPEPLNIRQNSTLVYI